MNTERSPVRACCPVPESGQSSSVWPAAASASRAASLSGIVKVLASMITQPPAADAAISAATAASAAGLGSDRMMTGACSATAAAEPAVSTPSAAARSRASAETS